MSEVTFKYENCDIKKIEERKSCIIRKEKIWYKLKWAWKTQLTTIGIIDKQGVIWINGKEK